MAKNKDNSSGNLAKLTISRVEAAEKIGKQIERGSIIRDLKIRNSDELDQARSERNKWSNYNYELLKRIFDRSDFAEEYAHWISVFVAPQSLADQIQDFQESVTEKIGRLESIQERLELVPEPTKPTSSLKTSLTDEHFGDMVFIVHGHDEGAKETVSRFVEKLGLNPIVLHEQPSAGRAIIQKLEDYSNVAFAIILLTSDDIGAPKAKPHEQRPRARQNVIFELGYFIGKLGRSRVCTLHQEDVEIPSDYEGVIYIPLDAPGAWRLHIAREMKEAGMKVDMNKAL